MGEGDSLGDGDTMRMKLAYNSKLKGYSFVAGNGFEGVALVLRDDYDALDELTLFVDSNKGSVRLEIALVEVERYKGRPWPGTEYSVTVHDIVVKAYSPDDELLFEGSARVSIRGTLVWDVGYAPYKRPPKTLTIRRALEIVYNNL